MTTANVRSPDDAVCARMVDNQVPAVQQTGCVDDALRWISQARMNTLRRETGDILFQLLWCNRDVAAGAPASAQVLANANGRRTGTGYLPGQIISLLLSP